MVSLLEMSLHSNYSGNSSNNAVLSVIIYHLFIIQGKKIVLFLPVDKLDTMQISVAVHWNWLISIVPIEHSIKAFNLN